MTQIDVSDRVREESQDGAARSLGPVASMRAAPDECARHAIGAAGQREAQHDSTAILAHIPGLEPNPHEALGLESGQYRELRHSCHNESCGINYDVYTLRPGSEHEAANYHPDEEAKEHFLLVNGLTTEMSNIRRDLESVVDTAGRSVTAVLNDAENSFLEGALKAILGIFDNKIGKELEPAVSNLMNEIIDRIEAGKVVHLIPYSQGSVITSNAMDLLHDYTNDPDWRGPSWDEISSKVKISTFGAAMQVWHKDLDVRAYEHSFDWVSIATKPLNWIRLAFNRVLGDGTKKLVEPVVINNSSSEGAHSFQGYMQDWPGFLIKRSQERFSEQSSVQLAREMHDSIQRARLSDDKHIEILERLLASADGKFALEFVKLVEQSDGKGRRYIGNFEVPSFTQFEKLAMLEAERKPTTVLA